MSEFIYITICVIRNVYHLKYIAVTVIVILVRTECVRQRNEVAIKLGIIFSSSSSLSPLPVIC